MSWLSNIVSGFSNAVSYIPIVGGIANGISSTVNGINAERQHAQDKSWSAEQAELNRNFQREERLATQEYNEKMWHMNNEYNSPANQIKLAREAGINPGSLFGDNFGQFVGSQPVKSQASAGSMASSPGSLASSLLTGYAQAFDLLASAHGKGIANSYAPVLNQKAIAKADEEIHAIAAKRGLDQANEKQILDMLDLMKGKTEAEIHATLEQANMLIEQTNKLKEEADILAWQKQFRDNFGVSHDADWFEAIMQLALSGEKGSNVVTTMLSTIGALVGTLLGYSNGTASRNRISPM